MALPGALTQLTLDLVGFWAAHLTNGTELVLVVLGQAILRVVVLLTWASMHIGTSIFLVFLEIVRELKVTTSRIVIYRKCLRFLVRWMVSCSSRLVL